MSTTNAGDIRLKIVIKFLKESDSLFQKKMKFIPIEQKNPRDAIAMLESLIKET